MSTAAIAAAAALPRDAVLAACLLAVDPLRLGGIHLTTSHGPRVPAFLELVRKLSPRAPVRKVPPQVSLERLVGGLDLTRTLKSGKPVIERGLLASADGGFVTIAMAERLDPQAAAVIASALAERTIEIERHGARESAPCRFGVIALDEGSATDERMPQALSQMLAIHLDLDAQAEPDSTLTKRATAARVIKARDLLPDVEISDDAVQALCTAAVTLGVLSLRAGPLAVAVARAHAAFDGRDAVEEDDIVAAGRLVLAPRATRVPMAPPEEAEQPPEEPPPPEQEKDDGDRADDQPLPDRPLEDVVLEAALATLPPDLLAELAAGGAVRSRSSGRSGARLKATSRGRPIGSRRGTLGRGAKLDLVATLRAAAPWQPLRRSASKPSRIEVREDDYRIVRFRQRSGTTTIFAVDASGSQALNRLGEAKGAVELLLAECYVRRDQVALVAFRGAGAEVLLPPTRSLARAKRSLEGLPGGGATPLAAGIAAATVVARAELARGRAPTIVILTDGRGNVALSGEQGRQAAETDALAMGRLVRSEALTAIVVDTAQRKSANAEKLAAEMGARYVALPHADAQRLSRAVQQIAGGR
ncbi:MAG: magnesium chelatase subunit D [Hyphomicrobiales bacterium]